MSLRITNPPSRVEKNALDAGWLNMERTSKVGKWWIRFDSISVSVGAHSFDQIYFGRRIGFFSWDIHLVVVSAVGMKKVYSPLWVDRSTIGNKSLESRGNGRRS